MRFSSRFIVVALALGAAACGAEEAPASQPLEGGAGDGGQVDAGPIDVLLFSRTMGYRHASIARAHELFQAPPADMVVTITEEPAVFTDEGLADFEVVMFVSTTGDVLDDAQQGALQRFVEGGGGFVGVHAAADTEHDWPWYETLVGAWFKSHPLLPLVATVTNEAPEHPATAHFPTTFDHNDEWYNFRDNPRARVSVLLSVDEADFGTMNTTDGEPNMGGDHPVAWHHAVGSGKSFYTCLGHLPATWADPAFVQHLMEGIRWAAR